MPETIPTWAKDAKALSCGANIKEPSSKVPDPHGFKKKEALEKVNIIDHDSRNRINAFLVQKAWQIATEPLKSVPMNIVMSYMSGTSLQIIPVITAVMLVSNPLKSILQVRSKFHHLTNREDEIPVQIVLAMIMYIIFQLVLMGIGLHKLNKMGLFPNTSSDWLAWETPEIYKQNTIRA